VDDLELVENVKHVYLIETKNGEKVEENNGKIVGLKLKDKLIHNINLNKSLEEDT